MSLFALDNWQVRNDLTLNLGVRYDIDRSVTVGNEFVDAKNASIVQRLGGTPPLSKINVDYNNVSPRLGFAWTPTKDRRTKIHGAVGLFYDQNHGNFNAIYTINSLLSQSTNILVAVNPADNPYWDGTGRSVCSSS